MADVVHEPTRVARHALSTPQIKAQSALFRYGVAVLSVAVAFELRLLLEPTLQDLGLYLLFVPAVLVAGGIGGLGPGILATLLSLVLGASWRPTSRRSRPR